MFITLIPRVIEELKKNLTPKHMVGDDAQLFQQFIATLFMAEGFFLVAN